MSFRACAAALLLLLFSACDRLLEDPHAVGLEQLQEVRLEKMAADVEARRVERVGLEAKLGVPDAGAPFFALAAAPTYPSTLPERLAAEHRRKEALHRFLEQMNDIVRRKLEAEFKLRDAADAR